MRKPHFRYYAHVWSCASVADWGLVIGYGYKWRDAYRDWLAEGGEPV